MTLNEAERPRRVSAGLLHPRKKQVDFGSLGRKRGQDSRVCGFDKLATDGGPMYKENRWVSIVFSLVFLAGGKMGSAIPTMSGFSARFWNDAQSDSLRRDEAETPHHVRSRRTPPFCRRRFHRDRPANGKVHVSVEASPRFELHREPALAGLRVRRKRGRGQSKGGFLRQWRVKRPIPNNGLPRKAPAGGQKMIEFGNTLK